MDVGAGGTESNVIGWLPSLDVVIKRLVVDVVDSEPINAADSGSIDVVDSEPIIVVNEADEADEVIYLLDEPLCVADKPPDNDVGGELGSATDMGDGPGSATDVDDDLDTADWDVGAAETDTVDGANGPRNLSVEKWVDVVDECTDGVDVFTDGVDEYVDDEVDDCIEEEVDDWVDEEVATARYLI